MFSEEDIISVLAAVKGKHANLALESSNSREIENNLKLCRSILEWLVEDGKTLLENLQEKVLVPVQSSRNKLVLEPCKNLPKSRSSVSSDMEHCQGPPCGLTTTPFLPTKILRTSIASREATKVEDLAKIGRFRLGFNAVYNLTDVVRTSPVLVFASTLLKTRDLYQLLRTSSSLTTPYLIATQNAEKMKNFASMEHCSGSR